MLQSLSEGAKGGLSKFILVGILFLAVAGLVLTDVGGFFRDGVNSTNIAEVGSQSIPAQDFDRYARRFLSQQGMSVENAYRFGIINQILNGYIRDVMMMQEAQKMGIRLSEKLIAKELYALIAPSLTGTTTPQEALDQLLRQQGLSEQALTRTIRRGSATSLLQQTILSGAEKVPSTSVEAFYRYQNEQRDFEILIFDQNAIELNQEITVEEMREFYQTAKAEYAVPERRSLTLALLDPQDLQEQITVSDENIQNYYETHQHLYDTGQRRDIAQVVVDTEDRARDVLEAVQQEGQSLEAAAPENTYRQGTGIAKDGLPEQLAEIVFADRESEIRGPVKTPLGWHIIEILSDVKSGAKPLPEVRDRIQKNLQDELFNQTLFNTIDMIDDQIDEGVKLEELVENYQLDTLSLGPVDRAGLNEEGKDVTSALDTNPDEILESAFALAPGEISPITELENGHFAVVRVDQITEQSFIPFEEVQEKIANRLEQARKKELNQQRANQALTSLQKDTQSMEELAQDKGSTLTKLEGIKRNIGSEIPKEITQELLNQLFASDPGNYIQVTDQDRYLIGQAHNPKLPDNRDLTESEKEQLQEELQNVQSRLIMMTYFQDLTQDYKVQINNALLDQLYGLNTEASR